MDYTSHCWELEVKRWISQQFHIVILSFQNMRVAATLVPKLLILISTVRVCNRFEKVHFEPFICQNSIKWKLMFDFQKAISSSVVCGNYLVYFYPGRLGVEYIYSRASKPSTILRESQV